MDQSSSYKAAKSSALWFKRGKLSIDVKRRSAWDYYEYFSYWILLIVHVHLDMVRQSVKEIPNGTNGLMLIKAS